MNDVADLVWLPGTGFAAGHLTAILEPDLLGPSRQRKSRQAEAIMQGLVMNSQGSEVKTNLNLLLVERDLGSDFCTGHSIRARLLLVLTLEDGEVFRAAMHG